MIRQFSIVSSRRRVFIANYPRPNGVSTNVNIGPDQDTPIWSNDNRRFTVLDKTLDETVAIATELGS